ncbi:hypothetical protein C3488_13355 [Streptomyces sp. Ru72]|nr:hypothetical protein C3488_13355 [Streptomyces sp. Ru72]
MAQAWKQRVRVLPDGRPRRTAHAVFLAVRTFYLDLSQWAMEDPARWATWAAPCPISEADIRGYIKETRHRQARMQQRTRTLVPVLPQLVHATERDLARRLRPRRPLSPLAVKLRCWQGKRTRGRGARPSRTGLGAPQARQAPAVHRPIEVQRSVFASCGQEAFFEGHVHALQSLGGVPRSKVRYDCEDDRAPLRAVA